MPSAIAGDSQRELERRKGQLQRLNRMLAPAFALLVVALVWDAARSVLEAREPAQPLAPELGMLREPSPAVPSLTLPETLFSPAEVSVQKPPEAPALEPPKWRLKGVLMGATPRALVEDPEAKQGSWVTEGQMLGPWRVTRIEERSILLEAEGASHEIRM